MCNDAHVFVCVNSLNRLLRAHISLKVLLVEVSTNLIIFLPDFFFPSWEYVFCESLCICVCDFAGCDQLCHTKGSEVQPSNGYVPPVARQPASLWFEFLQ